jgi:L-ribulose-5-phosphate 3-epimerase
MIDLGFMQGRLCDQIGENIQAFPWDDWRREFKIASEVGFSAMEWTLDASGLHENPLLTPAGQAEIKTLSSKHKVQVVSVTGDCFMQAPFWKTADRDEQNRLVSDLLSVVDACSSMCIQKIVVPIVDNGSIENEDEEVLLLQYFLKFSKYLRRSRVRIMFETDFSPSKNKEFICKLPADVFGINYDSGNSASLGYNVTEEFKLFSDRIGNIHIKDRNINGGSVPLGEGNVDFIAFLKCVQNINYSGNLILQTARAVNGEHSSALISYRNFINNIWTTI